jgi:hypothetical protein
MTPIELNRKVRILRFVGFHFCLIGVMLFASCESYRFANPLPVDSKNIYKTPKRLRALASDKEGKGGILFEKHVIRSIEDDTLKIINGIWFSPRDTSHIKRSDTTAWKALDKLKSYDSRYSIKFDSIKKTPIDTVENYVMKHNKIYAVVNRELSEGHPFVIKRDTIYVSQERQLIALGTDCFFRKVDPNHYLLNIRDGQFGEDSSPWWQVYLIAKREDGKIILFDWDDKIKDDPSLIYSGAHNYFDSQWTREDILKLIRAGAFDDLNQD